MAKNFLTKETSGTGLSILDAIGLSASKTILVDNLVTPLMNRFTGGNVFINSVVKIVSAGAIATMRNKVSGVIATSFVVSAGDDLFGLAGGISGLTGSNVANANVDKQARAPAGQDTFGDANVGSNVQMRFI